MRAPCRRPLISLTCYCHRPLISLTCYCHRPLISLTHMGMVAVQLMTHAALTCAPCCYCHMQAPCLASPKANGGVFANLRLMTDAASACVPCLLLPPAGSLTDIIHKGVFQNRSSKGMQRACLRAVIRTAREVAQGMSHLHSCQVRRRA